jgi:protein SCO1/2
MATPAAQISTRQTASGIVLDADPVRNMLRVSVTEVRGGTAAGVLTLGVGHGAMLAGLETGNAITFALARTPHGAVAESVRVRRNRSAGQDPARARRLALLREIASHSGTRALRTGEAVPRFSLVDTRGRTVQFADLRGRVVAINFTYATCQLPDYCLRLVNHFGALRRRFTGALGRDLVFLTLTFDPRRDTPDVLAEYAAQWNPDPRVWMFLTGRPDDVQPVLDLFGVTAFPAEGLLDHALHTVVIDASGRLAATLEGNDYSSEQLGDVIETVLARG